MFNPFRRSKPVQIDSVKTYKIVLYHDAGTEVELPAVPEQILKFVKNNLGRDQILSTDTHLINLSKFSLATFESAKVSN